MKEFEGPCLVARSWALDPGVSPLLKKMAGFLNSFLPFLPVARIAADTISRDPAEVKKYVEDPLNYHGPIKVKSAHQFNQTIDVANAEFGKVRLPVLIVHGKEDKLVPYSGSVALHAQCGSADKTLTLYEAGYHELMNDLEREAVIGSIRDWILERS